MALDPETVEALRAHRTQQQQERALVPELWHPVQTDHLGTARTHLVFTWEDGRLISPERFTIWFKRHCQAAGLPVIRLRDVRHSSASAGLAKATGWHEVKVISERLGHTNLAITIDTYSHVLPAADEATATTLASAILGVRRAPEGPSRGAPTRSRRRRLSCSSPAPVSTACPRERITAIARATEVAFPQVRGGASGGTRTPKGVNPLGPKPSASASSATLAWSENLPLTRENARTPRCGSAGVAPVWTRFGHVG
jgi:hypothetical protein